MRTGLEPLSPVTETRRKSRMAHDHPESRLATFALCLSAEAGADQHPRPTAEGQYQYRTAADSSEGIDHLSLGHRALGRLYDRHRRAVARLRPAAVLHRRVPQARYAMSRMDGNHPRGQMEYRRL